MTPLAEVIKSYFTEDYVLDDAHTSWKEMLQASNMWVSAQQMLSFPNVSQIANSASDVLDAAATLGALFEVDKGAERLRRAAPLDLSKDPAARTVFVRPIPSEAKDDEIAAFFGSFGAVVKVVRRTFTHFDASAGQRQRNRPSAFVEFDTPESAKRCIDAKPSYGRLGNLADHFVPKLVVEMKGTHMQQEADKAELEYHRNRRAQMQQQGAEGAASKVVTKFVPEGSILKARLGDGVTWRDVKTLLGGLAKDICTIVYVKEDPRTKATYVFMKSTEGTRRTLDKYHASVGSDAVLAKKILALEVATGGEEVQVRTAYLQGGNEQAKKKHAKNLAQKRDRDDE
eukprot:PhM_4_TR17342/c0_g1_i1/m.41195